jgi:hypothetical protein
MGGYQKDVARRLAIRVYKDPTADAVKRQLASALLLLLDGKLPQ